MATAIRMVAVVCTAEVVEKPAAVETIAALKTIAAVEKGAFTAHIAKAFYKRSGKRFPSFILFRIAPFCFTKASIAHNVFMFSALCQ